MSDKCRAAGSARASVMLWGSILTALLLNCGLLLRREVRPTMHVAAARGDFDAVKRMLANGEPADQFPGIGFVQPFPLHLAVEAGDIQMVQLLVNSGADIDGGNSSAMPPLVLAAAHSRADILVFLLSRGGNPNVRERLSGATALHAASLYGCDECVRMLLVYGASASLKDLDGWSAMDHSLSKGYSLITEMLEGVTD